MQTKINPQVANLDPEVFGALNYVLAQGECDCNEDTTCKICILRYWWDHLPYRKPEYESYHHAAYLYSETEAGKGWTK